MKNFFGPLERGTLNVNKCNDSLPDVGIYVLYWVEMYVICFSKA